MRTVTKSAKLANVCYDIRGPIMDAAKKLEDDGQKIIKLNIGNLAVFGFDAPEEVQQDMIRNLPNSAGYSDSKGIFAARKAVMHETQKQGIRGVTLDDIYLGNGASELISMATNALLDNGDELLLPAPDYPLWTAATSLSGGRSFMALSTNTSTDGCHGCAGDSGRGCTARRPSRSTTNALCCGTTIAVLAMMTSAMIASRTMTMNPPSMSRSPRYSATTPSCNPDTRVTRQR